MTNFFDANSDIRLKWNDNKLFILNCIEFRKRCSSCKAFKLFINKPNRCFYLAGSSCFGGLKNSSWLIRTKSFPDDLESLYPGPKLKVSTFYNCTISVDVQITSWCWNEQKTHFVCLTYNVKPNHFKRTHSITYFIWCWVMNRATQASAFFGDILCLKTIPRTSTFCFFLSKKRGWDVRNMQI